MADPWAEYRIPSTSPRKQVKSLADEVYDDIAETALKTDELKRQREAAAAAAQANNPEQAAKARQLATRHGVPPEAVEDDIGGYELLGRMDGAASASKDPRLADWLNGNSNIASDDFGGLMSLRDDVDIYKQYTTSAYGIDRGKAYTSQGRKRAMETAAPIVSAFNEAANVQTAMARGTRGQIAGSLRAGTAMASSGIYGTAAAVAGLFGAEETESNLLRDAAVIRQYADDNRGKSTSFIADSLYGGVESLPIALAAAATGSAAAGLTMFGTTTGGQEYVSARESGLDVGDSIGYGASQGMIEVAFEKAPLDELLKIAGGSGVKRAIKRFVVGEVLGEQATTALQDLNEWATLNPDKPFSAYLAERPEAAARTLLGTFSGSAPQVAVSLGLRKAIGEQTRLATSEAQLTALDTVMENASVSKVRPRDAAAFKALIDKLAGDNENIYIPAEVIAAYNQDYSNDEFWGDYSNDINEGLSTGGEVSIPLSVAAARLAGTPAWEAIKGDVRASPGGASLNEIERANAELDDLKFEATEQVEKADKQARREALPGERLRQSVRDRLMNTGMTPEMAGANAEIVAALFETRAANRGQEVTGREFDPVSVQRVLPELLATQPADTLDMVINAMRHGKDAVEGVGPSLLDFIKKRGGINDTGGDLKSMGLDKRLIRDFNADQGALGLSGAGDYGLDTTLRAAIEEGFFPELANVENMDGPSELDTQVLLDAIGQEVGGQKVFAETREDTMRAAAEELRQLLSSANIDPETATDADIKAMVESDGRRLDQPAFHGSPHIFDKFSLDAIGTGEGAQAYGWGLYFAGRKEIAQYYREALSSNDDDPIRLNDKPLDSVWTADLREKFPEVYEGLPESQQEQMDYVLGTIAQINKIEYLDGPLGSFDRSARALFDRVIRDKLTDPPEKGEGRLYEVEIPEDGEYLLWDAPLSEQPDSVQKALAILKGDGKEADQLSDDELLAALGKFEQTFGDKEKTGQGFYKEVSADLARKAGRRDAPEGNGWQVVNPETHYDDRAASKFLHNLGIAGIKYLDGGSRKDGDGSYNYVVFDENAVSIRAYEQNLGEGAQGQIQFTEAGAIIKLFESSNASTFQHEMAHFWLERMKQDVVEGGSFADWETLLDWFKANGHEVTDTIPEGAHELFARSWERYLMEGKSPSTRLNSVFRKFAAWMKAVYRAVKNLNAPITPEVREVMDRMLATEEEIALKSDEQQTMLMFDDAVAAGMSEAEAKRYAELGDNARAEAEEELLGKVMRSIRARETKAWKEQEAPVRQSVTEAVERRPVFAALAMLREKDGQRLDKEWLEETYGKDSLKLLPSGIPLYAKRGDNADMLAEMAGFTSGDEMVRALIGLEQTRREMKEGGDKRSVKSATIDFEVAQEMHERFGDPLGDGTIEREALAAVQNELNGERLAMELQALGRKVGRGATTYKLAREWAKDRIASSIVSEAISGAAQQRYARTVAKAARDAQQAFLKGDNLTAFRSKQTEMLHNALAREAADASELVNSAVARMDKLAKQRTVKTMAQDYLDKIHGLLENYEFKRLSQRKIDARDSYNLWAQEQTAAGHDVVAVERLAQKKNWSRMTVEEMLALDDAVKQLRHLGRLKQKLKDGKADRDFNEVVGEAIMSLAQLPQKPPVSQFGGETRLQWIKNAIGSLHSVLVKMEEVFDHLDSENSQGIFNRIAFRPIVEAQERERVMLDDVMGRLLDAMKAVPKKSVKRWQERRVIPELIDPKTGEPAQMLGEELLVMAMNIGNVGNMEKLVGGFGWDKQHGGIDQARAVVMEVLNRELTADDWAYVQLVWDTIDELWPEISELEKRVNGFAPDKVEAVPIQTTIGELRGGYFPAVYDPDSKVGQRNLEVEEKGLFPSNYFRSTTRAGSTKERTEFKGPLHLSLGVINRHVAEVVHDITHREVVMNADKFLSDPRVQAATEAVLGPQVVQQFRPWLGHVANEWAADREGNSGAERFLKATRTNATVVGLGFRVSTMLLQISGYSNSIERVGLRYVMRGIRKMLTPGGFDFALSTSKELPSRMATMDRDIRDNARKMASKQGGVLDAAQQFAFHGIGYMDRMVSVGTWLGAYDKALAQGRDEDGAVYDADKAVRQSQGSGAAKDMARVQRGTGKMGEAWKLSTMFYSYSSAFYQRQYRLARNTSQAIRERDIAFIPEFSARVLWLFLVPSILAEVLAGRGPEDDEDEAAWAMGNIITSQFQAIPFGREIAGGLKSGFGYSYTPAEGFGKSIVASAKDVKRVYDGKETKRATRNFLEMVGYTTGKIPGQLATTTQFFVDVGYGEQDPDTAAEWWKGITKGKIAD